MFYASVAGSVGVWGDLIAYATALAPGMADILFWILLILQNIAALGGIAVIIGAILFTTNRVGTGKFVVGLGAGMGIIGLIILIYNMYMAMGFDALLELFNMLSNSMGMLGVVLTIIGRILVKKPE